jgi:hypothetical protein
MPRKKPLAERILNALFSAEVTNLWHLHLVHSKKDGNELRGLLTGSFATLTTMSTLLVGSQVATLFSPSRPTEAARTALETKDAGDVAFWAGLILCISILSSIITLIAILVAWALFKVISGENAHIIFRSSLVTYATLLPVRLSHISVYLFIIWINVFFFVLAAWQVALPLSLISFCSMLHVAKLYKSVGTIILYSGAMGDEEPVMAPEVEEDLEPSELTAALMEKVAIAKGAHIPVSEQYRIRYQDQLEILEQGGSLRLEELRLPEYQSHCSREENDDEGGNDDKKQE